MAVIFRYRGDICTRVGASDNRLLLTLTTNRAERYAVGDNDKWTVQSCVDVRWQ